MQYSMIAKKAEEQEGRHILNWLAAWYLVNSLLYTCKHRKIFLIPQGESNPQPDLQWDALTMYWATRTEMAERSWLQCVYTGSYVRYV